MKRSYYVPEILGGRLVSDTTLNFSDDEDASLGEFFEAFKVKLSISDIFNILPYAKKITQDQTNDKDTYQVGYLPMSSTDTHQKRAIYKKSLALFSNSALIKFLLPGSMDRTGQETYIKLRDSKINEEHVFNLVPLLFFMMTVSMYDMLKADGDYENKAIKYAELRHSNMERYTKLASEYIFKQSHDSEEYAKLRAASIFINRAMSKLGPANQSGVKKGIELPIESEILVDAKSKLDKDDEKLPDNFASLMITMMPKFDMDDMNTKGKQNSDASRKGWPMPNFKESYDTKDTTFGQFCLFTNYVFLDSYRNTRFENGMIQYSMPPVSDKGISDVPKRILKAFSLFAISRNWMVSMADSDTVQFLNDIDNRIDKLLSATDNGLMAALSAMPIVFDVQSMTTNNYEQLQLLLFHICSPSLKSDRAMTTKMIKENGLLYDQIVKKLKFVDERATVGSRPIADLYNFYVANSLNKDLKKLLDELNRLT